MSQISIGKPRELLSGLQPFEPARDLKAVIELLKLGFGDDLDAQDRRWLAELENLAGAGPLLQLLRVLPAIDRSFSGFVWYEGGRLVANTSLMRAPAGLWVIANVVSHPEFRRRGIGRRLTRAAIGAARQRGARQIQLQVRRSNEGARALYRDLGFRDQFGMVTLRLRSAGDAMRLATPGTEFQVVTWGRSGTTRARRLLARAGRLDGESPPGPVVRSCEAQPWLSRIEDWLRGQHRYRWAAAQGGEYRAALVADAMSHGGPHILELVTDEHWTGRVEAPLVDAALIALARHEPFAVEAKIRDVETGAQAALLSAGFQYVRTLERMVLDLA